MEYFAARRARAERCSAPLGSDAGERAMRCRGRQVKSLAPGLGVIGATVESHARRYGPWMGLLVYLVLLAVSGLIIGALARLALPGPDPMSIGMTILIGLAGSFIGGLLTLAITGGRNAGGIVVSVAGATLIVYLMRRRRGGSITDPGLGPRERR
jgi:uncharacterized membrane protein YeaQ/YmgE (transglycosylase-associated protein family)